MFSVHSSGSVGNIGTNAKSNTYYRHVCYPHRSVRISTLIWNTFYIQVSSRMCFVFLGLNKPPAISFTFILKLINAKPGKQLKTYNQINGYYKSLNDQRVFFVINKYNKLYDRKQNCIK